MDLLVDSGLRIRVSVGKGSEVKATGLGFRVQGLGFRV